MPKYPYKPTRLKLLEGNRSHSLRKAADILKEEPHPAPLRPKTPRDLDKEAAKTWKTLAPKLEKLGLLTEIDGDMFAILCQIRSRLVMIHELLRDAPLTTANTRGYEKPSPLVTMEKQYFELFRTYAGDFGLTPRGRVGLSIGGSQDDDGSDLLS